MNQVLLQQLIDYFIEKYAMSEFDAEEAAKLNAALLDKLRKEIVHFAFEKTDGTIREAYGTLQSDAIPETKGKRTSNYDVQVYYDTEKQEYRCFKKNKLMKIF